MRISRTLVRNTTIVLAMVILGAVVTTVFTQRMQRDVHRLAEVELPLEQAVLEMEINADEAALATLTHVATGKQEDLALAADAFRDFEGYASVFEALAETRTERDLQKRVLGIYADFKRLSATMIAQADLRRADLAIIRRDVEEIGDLIDTRLLATIDPSSSAEARTKVEAALSIARATGQELAAVEGFVLVADPKQEELVAEVVALVAIDLEAYRATALTETERTGLDQIEADLAEAAAAGLEAIALTKKLNSESARFIDSLYTMDAILDDEIQLEAQRETRLAAAAANASGQTVIFASIVVAVFVGFVAVFTGWSLSTRVRAGAAILTAGAEEYGKGEFDHRIVISGTDEFAMLAGVFNSMAIDRAVAEVARLELEERARHRQKLEAIGTLAGGVAHEINNPVNGIMNYAHLISDRLEAGSPLREYSDGIAEESARIANIVRDLLGFARQEQEEHSPARIIDIVTATFSLLRTILKHDEIKLEVDVPDDLPVLKCRNEQIQQVLTNLITNARDALNERYPGFNENKILRLSTSLFEREGRRWVRVTVEDYGTGITDETRARMFEPFFTTKERTKGTGLGLSISHGIVLDHHGELTVESEPGQYTRLHLELPLDNGWSLEEKPGDSKGDSKGDV